MKIRAPRVADVLVELCLASPPEEMSDLVEAAISKLDLKALRSFPRLVSRAFDRHVRYLMADVETPTGKESPDDAKLLAQLEETLGKKLEIFRIANPSLIGGIRLRVGDDKFDYSVRGALERLEEHLTPHAKH